MLWGFGYWLNPYEDKLCPIIFFFKNFYVRIPLFVYNKISLYQLVSLSLCSKSSIFFCIFFSVGKGRTLFPSLFL